MHRATDAHTLRRTAVLVNNFSLRRHHSDSPTMPVLLLRLLAPQETPYLGTAAAIVLRLESLDRMQALLSLRRIEIDIIRQKPL